MSAAGRVAGDDHSGAVVSATATSAGFRRLGAASARDDVRCAPFTIPQRWEPVGVNRTLPRRTVRASFDHRPR
jgi:hypothetical protein